MKEVFEFKVGDPQKTIGFKFGTMALAVTEQKEGRSLKSILESMSSGKISTMTLLNLMYGAAVQYADSKKVDNSFSVSDVSDWIEEIGLEEIERVIREGFKQYVPKNLPSLAKTGEMMTTV